MSKRIVFALAMALALTVGTVGVATATPSPSPSPSDSPSASPSASPAPLQVTITVPASGLVGAQIAISALATGGTQPYSSYLWTVDGLLDPDIGTPAQLIFSTAGSHAIEVEAEDSAGQTADASATITITDSASPSPSPTIAPIVGTVISCGNDLSSDSGETLGCHVTVDNTITTTGSYAVVTLTECHGAIVNPLVDPTCTTRTLAVPVNQPVTQVIQCNSSANRGSNILDCSVVITNHFYGVSPDTIPVSVNQCVDSGSMINSWGMSGGIACHPFPASAANATITQCNGSDNLDFTVVPDSSPGPPPVSNCTATGTESRIFPIKIDQCDGSANSGISQIQCSADEINVFTPATPASPRPSASLKKTTADSPSNGSSNGNNLPIVLSLLALSVAAILFVAPKRIRNK